MRSSVMFGFANKDSLHLWLWITATSTWPILKPLVPDGCNLCKKNFKIPPSQSHNLTNNLNISLQMYICQHIQTCANKALSSCDTSHKMTWPVTTVVESLLIFLQLNRGNVWNISIAGMGRWKQINAKDFMCQYTLSYQYRKRHFRYMQECLVPCNTTQQLHKLQPPAFSHVFKTDRQARVYSSAADIRLQ